MKRRVLWLGLSFLLAAVLVLALALSACGPKEEEPITPTTPTKPAEPAKPIEKEPQYGGTITVFTQGATKDPGSPDIAVGGGGPSRWLNPIQERPLIGAFEKYGPRGTGEYAFQLHEYIPDKYVEGCLIESWEVNPDKVIWHVRSGIYWHGNRPNVMAARELTAEDIAFDLNYFRDAAPGKAFMEMTGDIYAQDRYTVVIEVTDFNLGLMYIVGYEDRSLISPPETHEAGAGIWENQVGTGPFMLKEYVVGSHMTYVRNPDYWKTTTVDGKEYEIPFVDEMVYPIIPDVSTQIAALRTGTLDFHIQVPPAQWATLEKTAPDLLFDKVSSGIGNTTILKCSEPPFDSRVVRRAMMIGLDLKAFRDLHGVGPLEPNWFPTFEGDPTVHTEIKDMPAETAMLFDYNPELAKQMLAEAGYPDGFTVEYYVNSALQDVMDRAALVKDMWARIGVEVEIKPVETVAYRKYQTEKSYNNMINGGGEVANPLECLSRRGQTDGYFNFSMWSNEHFDELIIGAQKEQDSAKRMRLLKEAAIIMLNEVNIIPTDPTPKAHYWWPWIKNYYGERAVADKDIAHILAYAWIDEDLKAEMGH